MGERGIRVVLDWGMVGEMRVRVKMRILSWIQ